MTDPHDDLDDDSLDRVLDRGFQATGDDAKKDDPAPAPSVIDRIGEITGSKPAVSLREVDPSGQTPMLKPLVAEGGIARETGKYMVQGLLGQGGVGVVHKGHDGDLGRDVAMKFLHEKYKDEPAILHRFVEEAQIGGQLQHPGIVPVYELGMSDGRPFFTMKMVKGQTLAKKLADRASPADERRTFLSIFEDICQTMAYAHAREVVHRDLKPANIMIGAFGEVQVVDWGMGKVLEHDGVADEERAAERQSPASVVETVRSAGHGTQSVMGSVMGTPAYMPPEQARGDVQAMDTRSDVFSLGAILCEILTGQPPYIGEPGDLIRMAAMCELDGAQERLQACGAEEDLIKLARNCLMPAPAARPQSAELVAKAVHDHLAAAEQRVHEATVRALALKRTQKLGIALSGTLVVAAILLGSWWRAADQHAEALAQVNRQQQEQLQQRQKRLEQANEAALKMQAFLTPVAKAVEKTEVAARRVQASQQLRDIHVALHNHHGAFGAFPGDFCDENGEPLLSWRVRILPYLGHNELFGQFHLDEPWDSPHNETLLADIPKVYARVIRSEQSKPLRDGAELVSRMRARAQGPEQGFDEELTIEYLQLQFTNQILEFAKRSRSFGRREPAAQSEPVSYHVDSSQPLTFYQGFEGPGTMFERGKELRMTDVTDGTSNTIMVVEALEPVPWTKPGGLAFDSAKPLPELGGLGFEDVIYIGLVSGSIRSFEREVDRAMLKRMVTRNGGEPVR